MLRKGLCTYATLVCEDCKASTLVVSSYAGESRMHAVNLRSALAKVAIGESHSSFEIFCCLMNLLPLSSKSTFVEYHQLDCLVSVDGTWQKRGHQSLLGAVYVIEYQTGKVLDYKVFCKFCHNCNLHKNWDKDIADFLTRKESHESICESNFVGNSGSMELWDLFRYSNVLCTISFVINILFQMEIAVL